MCEILCSTGTMIGRPNGRNYRLLEEFSKQLECDGFEFMMYDSWYEETDELVDFLQGLGLYIPVVHCEKRIGERISKGEELDLAYGRFETNCRIAQKLGAKKLVMHLWDGLTSDAFFDNNINAYPILREIASRYQLDLLVENVVCNHESPMKHWCDLAEKYPDIHFIFDTKMAAFHEELEQLYDAEHQWLWQDDHIRHFHVNDYAGGYKDWKNLRTLPIGRGHVDFEQFFSCIREKGYDGTLTVESTAFDADGVVDINMLNRQFAYIREKMGLDHG